MQTNKIHTGDCLDVLTDLEDGSVDLLLTDPPYGTVKGASLDGWESQTTDWDTAVPPRRLFEMANRLLRQGGRLVLFAQEPYTSKLITSAIGNLPFNYRMVWKKDHFANSLLAKNAPVSVQEDVLVFTKEYDLEGIHPLRSYFADVMEYIGLSKSEIMVRVGQRADHCFRHSSSQFELCTRETYNELIQEFSIDSMGGFRTYNDLQAVDEQHKEEFEPTFNLQDGQKYKTDVLEYAKDYDGHHPTQKPVALMKDLVETFSNEGDLVVDPFAGSGSTLVAANRLGREYIGVEQKPEYAEIARVRVGQEPDEPQHLRNDAEQNGLEAYK